MAKSNTHILHESRSKLPEYAEACYLAEQIELYANKKGTEIPQKYKHLALTDPNTSDSTAILNNLRGHGKAGQDFFQDVPKSISGDFQPWIKIFKVKLGTQKAKSDKDIVIPLKFNNLRNLGVTDSHKLGVAFRSFTFDFEGVRPVEIDTYVHCNLKLYFESPKALFKMYTEKGHKYSFADLIRRAVIKKSDKKGVSSDQLHLLHDEKYFRIRVDVGYTPPPFKRLVEAYRGAGFSNPNKKARNLRAALKANRMQLYLNLLKHSINPIFDAPDGGFELSIDYVGSIETSFRSRAANILFTPADKGAAKGEMEKKKHFLKTQNAAFGDLKPEQRDKLNAYAEGGGNINDLISAEAEAVKATQYGRGVENMGEVMKEVAPGISALLDFAGEAIVGPKASTKISEQGGGTQMTGDPLAQSAIELEATQNVLREQFGIESGKARATRIITYLQNREYHNRTDVGQTIYRAKKMSRMYSKILDRLTAENKLHFIQLPESELHRWFATRKAKAVAQSNKDRLKEIDKEIEVLGKLPQGETAQEQLNQLEANNNKILDLQDEKSVLEGEAITGGAGSQRGPAPPAVQNAGPNQAAAQESQAHMEKDAQVKAANVKAAEARKAGDSSPANEIPYTKMVTPADLSTRNIYFFYYGDLLDIVLEMLYEHKDEMDLDWWGTSNKKGTVKFLLGEVEFTNPANRKVVKESLAKIPITLKVWQEFWLENVIDQWRTEYFFDSFLNDTLTQLIVEALTGRCKDEGNVNVNVRAYPSYLTIKNINNKIVFSKLHGKYRHANDNAYYYSNDDSTGADPGNSAAENDSSKAKTGELILVQAASNSAKWFKNKSSDIKRGVYHLELGRENSTILNFQMNRSNQPHYLEAKLEQQGIDSYHVFGEPYNYDVTMYGNALLVPGKHVKISFPFTWFSKQEQIGLGIGGYCFILKTKNEIKALDARLEWTTNMQCLWQSFGGHSRPSANSGRGNKPITPVAPAASWSGTGPRPTSTVGGVRLVQAWDVGKPDTTKDAFTAPPEDITFEAAEAAIKKEKMIADSKKQVAHMNKSLSDGVVAPGHAMEGQKVTPQLAKDIEKNRDKIVELLRAEGVE